MPFFEPPTGVKDTAAVQGIPDDDTDVLNFMRTDNHRKYVSAHDALRNSDIYSAVSQLSGDLASVKLTANMPRAQGIINSPSSTASGRAFWQSMFAQLLLAGECFAYRWRNTNGLDIRWEYLRPSQVQPFLLSDGSGLVYTVTFDEPRFGVMQSIPQADIIHIRLTSINGGMTAMSPLEALSNELQIKDASNQLTLSALARSISAPGILSITHGGLLDAKKKASRSRQFMKQVNTSNGGPVVLDDLENYQPLEMKADVAKLLSQTDWTSKQIAKVYGIPDSILNGSGDQQSSTDQMERPYIKALGRYINNVVSELDDKLSATITPNIRPAVDPLGDSFANTLSGLAKNGTIANNQATWVLQDAGYFPKNMPEAIVSVKGGETNAEEGND
ncbi:phage portal protein [Lactiplantibacillus plantarum]|uniref:phage portal protein n=1 Tax=Lactiplantibacillus plantarum TaxID=1590 RepID=UPI0040356B71